LSSSIIPLRLAGSQQRIAAQLTNIMTTRPEARQHCSMWKWGTMVPSTTMVEGSRSSHSLDDGGHKRICRPRDEHPAFIQSRGNENPRPLFQKYPKTLQHHGLSARSGAGMQHVDSGRYNSALSTIHRPVFLTFASPTSFSKFGVCVSGECGMQEWLCNNHFIAVHRLKPQPAMTL